MERTNRQHDQHEALKVFDAIRHYARALEERQQRQQPSAMRNIVTLTLFGLLMGSLLASYLLR